jgi:hypothetical protein
LIYVGAGLIAAVFSLVVGMLFLFGAGEVLPALTSGAGPAVLFS